MYYFGVSDDGERVVREFAFREHCPRLEDKRHESG